MGLGTDAETAVIKQEGIHQELHENHCTGNCEANFQIFCWVTSNQGLDLVEGSAPSEAEKRRPHTE
jgi:hypothetical protein